MVPIARVAHRSRSDLRALRCQHGRDFLLPGLLMLPLRMAIDVRRFRGVFSIAAPLAVFLVAADLLVLAWRGPAPVNRITDDWHVIQWSDLEHAESQVANLE